jgi:hypothetical protein
VKEEIINKKFAGVFKSWLQKYNGHGGNIVLVNDGSTDDSRDAA